MSTSDALDELKRNAGTQFDPALVEVAFDACEQLERARIELVEPRDDEPAGELG